MLIISRSNNETQRYIRGGIKHKDNRTAYEKNQYLYIHQIAPSSVDYYIWNNIHLCDHFGGGKRTYYINRPRPDGTGRCVNIHQELINTQKITN